MAIKNLSYYLSFIATI
uniref:Uncharacterized protein n=1 Tax=Arundo donax TaxID=35708 RepID=A0A0A9AAZ3_ARUDO